MLKYLRIAVTALSLTACVLPGCGDGSYQAPPLPTSDRKIPDPVRIALEQGTKFELLSIDPRYPDKEQPKESGRRKVIGKTLISDGETRRRILAALEGGMRQVPPTRTCFDPRHGIRIEHKGKSIYLSICFRCNNVFVFVDEQRDPTLTFHTTDSPEPVFDEVLRAAGISLADKDAVRREW